MRIVLGVFFLFCLIAFPCAGEVFHDTFESGDPGLLWSDAFGFHGIVEASGEARLAGVTHPCTGESILKVATDGDSGGVHLVLGGGDGQDMSVEAWVFCEGNEGPTSHGGYQSLVARASGLGGQNFVRLSWDPDHSEAGDTGDGWVKLQAYDGATWDYLGIDFSQFGSATPGYILNGTSWPSGWHRFRLVVIGNQVSAFVDDMVSPRATGTLGVSLRDGQGGFYVYTSGDYAGYYDDFIADVTPAPTPTPTPPADFNVIIRNGEVYPDGYSGPLWVDIGINGELIEEVGDLSGRTAHRIIDASGLMVTPGFIDAHTHADNGGTLSAYVRQGVTTMVTGNCGSSPGVTNVGAYYDSLEGSLGPNYIGLVGHNNLRAAAGLSGTTPTIGQMAAMRNYLDAAMESGAFGLSTGLIYGSGYKSTTEEIIELAGVVANHDGIYATHMRDEKEAVLEAVDEAIRIGHEAGCRVQISHAKCAGPLAWGKVDQFLAKVDAANAIGDRVQLDQYPYTASQTTLNILLPYWALENWSDAVTNRRAELEVDVRALIDGRGGADRVYIISGSFSHQYLSDVASSLSKAPENVMIDDIGPGGGSAVYHVMLESDVRTFMRHPQLMVGSDGPTSAHPRGSSTFPRFWGHYVRDLGLFTKQEAVRKTSTMAAEQFRLLEQRRGALRPGDYADITIFDYGAIIDEATFENPTISPVGIEYVLINGAAIIDEGIYQARYSGRVLRLTDSLPVGHWRLY